jgi:hypothetical protein
MKTRRERILVTAALLAFGVIFCVLSLGLSSQARRFPLFAGALTIVMTSAQMIADLRRPTQEGGAAGAPGDALERSAILWTAALVAGVYLVGLAITLPLFTGLYWRIKDRAPWPSAIVVGLCVLGFVEGILAGLLRLELYEGIIGQWLRR